MSQYHPPNPREKINIVRRRHVNHQSFAQIQEDLCLSWDAVNKVLNDYNTLGIASFIALVVSPVSTSFPWRSWTRSSWPSSEKKRPISLWVCRWTGHIWHYDIDFSGPPCVQGLSVLVRSRAFFSHTFLRLWSCDRVLLVFLTSGHW